MNKGDFFAARACVAKGPTVDGYHFARLRIAQLCKKLQRIPHCPFAQVHHSLHAAI